MAQSLPKPLKRTDKTQQASPSATRLIRGTATGIAANTKITKAATNRIMLIVTINRLTLNSDGGSDANGTLYVRYASGSPCILWLLRLHLPPALRQASRESAHA